MIDLEKSRAVCEAATPGPWPQDFARIDDSQGGCSATGPIIRSDDQDDEERLAQADQDFIAHARTALPEALTEIEQLRDQLASAGFREDMLTHRLRLAEAVCLLLGCDHSQLSLAHSAWRESQKPDAEEK